MSLGLLAAVASSPALATPTELSFTPRATPSAPAAPDLPPTSEFSVQLVIDDDQAEGSTGVNGATARQFFWFNQFDAPEAFRLEEMWVLFEPGDNMSVGAPIDLVVFRDADGDPSNGAEFLASVPETIQVLDGSTFSVYPLPNAIEIEGGDVYLGVVPRFIDSGSTSPTFPAAIDTTVSQDHSWVAVWSGDVPTPPELPPDDLLVQPTGNFLIRGFGVGAPTVEIPTLSSIGAIALGLLLALAATASMTRRRSASAVAGTEVSR